MRIIVSITPHSLLATLLRGIGSSRPSFFSEKLTLLVLTQLASRAVDLVSNSMFILFVLAAVLCSHGSGLDRALNLTIFWDDRYRCCHSCISLIIARLGLHFESTTDSGCPSDFLDSESWFPPFSAYAGDSKCKQNQRWDIHVHYDGKVRFKFKFIVICWVILTIFTVCTRNITSTAFWNASHSIPPGSMRWRVKIAQSESTLRLTSQILLAT